MRVQNAPTPEQRVTRVDVTRDLVKRTITAKATFAAAPTTSRDSVVFVFLGTWSGSNCSFTATIAGAGKSDARNLRVTASRKRLKTSKKSRGHRSLSGRYFWGWLPTGMTASEGWSTRAVRFLDKKWACTDFPKSGKKPKCTRTTKHCKKYSYNAKTGVAKIGGQKVKVNTEGFRYRVHEGEGNAYFELRYANGTVKRAKLGFM